MGFKIRMMRGFNYLKCLFIKTKSNENSYFFYILKGLVQRRKKPLERK